MAKHTDKLIYSLDVHMYIHYLQLFLAQTILHLDKFTNTMYMYTYVVHAFNARSLTTRHSLGNVQFIIVTAHPLQG